MEKARLFVKVEGREYGPYETREIEELIREDRFGPNDFIRREGETGWFRAGNVAGLRTMFGSASAPREPTCPTCGSPLEPDAAFCTECGAKVTAAVAATPTSAAAAGVTCPQCGSAVEEGDAFCGECGGKLAAPAAEPAPPASPASPAEEKVKAAPTPPAPPTPEEKAVPPEPAPPPRPQVAPPPPPKETEAPRPTAAKPAPMPPSPPDAAAVFDLEDTEPAPPKRRGKVVAPAIGGGLLFLFVLAVAAFLVTDYLGVNPLTREEESVPAAPVTVEPPSGSGPEATATLVSAAGGGRSSSAMVAKLADHDDGVREVLEAEGPGSLTLELTVTSDGAVMKARVVSSSYGSAVNKRVENAARRWDFGAGTGVAKLKVKCKAAE